MEGASAIFSRRVGSSAITDTTIVFPGTTDSILHMDLPHKVYVNDPLKNRWPADVTYFHAGDVKRIKLTGKWTEFVNYFHLQNNDDLNFKVGGGCSEVYVTSIVDSKTGRWKKYPKEPPNPELAKPWPNDAEATGRSKKSSRKRCIDTTVKVKVEVIDLEEDVVNNTTRPDVEIPVGKKMKPNIQMLRRRSCTRKTEKQER